MKIFLGLAVIAGLIIGAFVLVTNLNITRKINLPNNLLASTSTPIIVATSTNSGDEFVFETKDFTKLDTSTWKTYKNDEQGYSIKYPVNLISSSRGSTLTLLFPKNIYFSWPLQDDARVTVTVSESCTPLMVPNIFGVASSTFTLNKYSFSTSEGHEGAAGNIYSDLVYDTEANGVCYHFSLYVSGSNGSSLYVENRSLVERYDAEHEVNSGRVLDIFNSIVNSFRLYATPDGLPEDQVVR